MCLRKTLQYPRECTLSVLRTLYKIEKVARAGPRKSKNQPSGVLAVGLLAKKVPFLQRLYHCLPLWIAFLLPLVFK